MLGTTDIYIYTHTMIRCAKMFCALESILGFKLVENCNFKSFSKGCMISRQTKQVALNVYSKLKTETQRHNYINTVLTDAVTFYIEIDYSVHINTVRKIGNTPITLIDL